MSDTVLLTSIVEHAEESSGVRMVRFAVGGEKHAAAIVNAVVGNYERVTGRGRPTVEQLQAMIGEKVTLLYTGENMLGAGLVTAREGKLFAGSGGGVSILPKGKVKNGFRVDAARVLDVFPGYATEAAKESVESVRERMPQLQALTKERLLELPASSDYCTLAVFGTYRLPDCTAVDALWVIGEYDADGDICDCNVLFLRPADGFSEHGSIYGEQLLQLPVGEVVGFTPISFADALRLTELDYDAAVDALLHGDRVAA